MIEKVQKPINSDIIHSFSSSGPGRRCSNGGRYFERHDDVEAGECKYGIPVLIMLSSFTDNICKENFV
jgi:hypothetical protein